MNAKKKVSFLDASDINRAISEVASLPTYIKAVLAGGSAMQVYGSNRLTRDVDFISNTSEVGGFRFLKVLSFGGASTISPSGVPVDFIVRNDDYSELYEEALNNASDAGLPVPVVAPEYLAAIKMVAGRVKDEEDLRLLIRFGLDVPGTRKIIKRTLGAYAAKDFDTYVNEVMWRASTESDE